MWPAYLPACLFTRTPSFSRKREEDQINDPRYWNKNIFSPIVKGAAMGQSFREGHKHNNHGLPHAFPNHHPTTHHYSEENIYLCLCSRAPRGSLDNLFPQGVCVLVCMYGGTSTQITSCTTRLTKWGRNETQDSPYFSVSNICRDLLIFSF